jgi:hypothetical protein
MPRSKAVLKSAELDPIDGGRLVFHVSQLSSNLPATVMIQACGTAGIPQRNQPFAPGLKVTSGPRVTEMLGNFNALVEVIVGKDENDTGGGNNANIGSISLSSRVVQETTIYDAQGKIINIEYSAAVKDPVTGATTGLLLPKQTGEASVYTQINVLRVERTENVLPAYAQNLLVGCTNLNTFFLFPTDYWLCAEISAVSNDNNRSFQCGYEFWGNQFGWLAGCVYTMDSGRLAKPGRNPKFNENPPRLRMNDLNGGAGVVVPGGGEFVGDNFQKAQQATAAAPGSGGLTIVRVQKQADFARLNITAPTNIDTP